MATGFSSVVATSSHKRLAGGLAAALTLATLAILPFAQTPLLPLPAFLPLFGMALLVTDLLTAFLLFGQLRLARLPALGVLACAYLYSGLVVIPHLLVFPGVFSETGLLGAGPQSAVWFWVLWHGGFPAIILIATMVERQWQAGTVAPAIARKISIVLPVSILSLVVGLTVLVTAGHDLLPPLVERDNYYSLITSGGGPVVFVINLTALLLMLRRDRLQKVGGLWLTVAVLASLLDVTLTLAGQSRFSLGWYAARISSLVSSSAILVVFQFEMTRLYSRVADLNERLEKLATIDSLTGIANRRHFDEYIDREWRRALRDKTALSLIFFDVDHFKAYNDRYGHVAGDECLRFVAQMLKSAMRRPADLACRYGGEEFAVILPNTDINGAHHLAETILERVRVARRSHDGNGGLGIVTLSGGVAAMREPGPDATLRDFIETADRALYIAKRVGRNRIASELGVARDNADYVRRSA